MKKFIALILSSVFMLTLAGCKKNSDNAEKVNDVKENKWGITLEAENVSPVGLTIVCNQSGGENVSELDTGSFFVIQKAEKSGWVDVDYLPQEYDIAWTAEAWIIEKDGITRWDINWEWIYGELPAGEYRIGKEIMNFRAPGDYDTEMVYAEFVIE